MADTFTIDLLHKEFAADVARYIGSTRQDLRRTVQYMLERVYNRIVTYTPVETGNLQGSWRPRILDEYTGKVSTHVKYAPVVEYGGYRGVGEKTIQIGGRVLGFGLSTNAGIFSKQAPGGVIRRALADEGREMVRQMRESLRKNWGR